MNKLAQWWRNFTEMEGLPGPILQRLLALAVLFVMGVVTVYLLTQRDGNPYKLLLALILGNAACQAIIDFYPGGFTKSVLSAFARLIPAGVAVFAFWPFLKLP